MIERSKIENGVVNMLKVNMGVKRDEKILVITDVPTLDEWVKKNSGNLLDAVQRSVLAKTIYEIAADEFPHQKVKFYPYPSTRRNGAEPQSDVAEEMRKFDIVIAITTYSLTHTNAREEACMAGARVASMPGFLSEMFSPGGPMAADYEEIAVETNKFADLLTKAHTATVKSKDGTDITFSIRGRKAKSSTGIIRNKGDFGNLPSGEAYIAPIEGTGRGRLVVVKGWYPRLEEAMILTFNEGRVVGIEGGGEVGDEFRELLALGRKEGKYVSRRNLAELGIGTNPNAKRPDNVLEAEKIKGTVHIAIGDNSHFGGTIEADLHQDFIIPNPELILDGKVVIKS